MDASVCVVTQCTLAAKLTMIALLSISDHVIIQLALRNVNYIKVVIRATESSC